MALKSTIYKAEIDITDIDRGYYRSHSLTIARHPSETEERLMVRLLAFILNADEDLVFCRGLSTEDEPDLWRKNLHGDIELWIEVGLPADRRVRKASNRSQLVKVYAYGDRTAPVWWEKNRKAIQGLSNVGVLLAPPETVASLAQMAERTMRLQCTVQDGELWVNNQLLHITELSAL